MNDNAREFLDGLDADYRMQVLGVTREALKSHVARDLGRVPWVAIEDHQVSAKFLATDLAAWFLEHLAPQPARPACGCRCRCEVLARARGVRR